MNDALIDTLTAQLTETSNWLDDAKADGTDPRAAAKAMRIERRNKRAQAEEMFGCREVKS